MLARTWRHDARLEGRIRILSLYSALKKDPLMKNRTQRLRLRVAWQRKKGKRKFKSTGTSMRFSPMQSSKERCSKGRRKLERNSELHEEKKVAEKSKRGDKKHNKKKGEKTRQQYPSCKNREKLRFLARLRKFFEIKLNKVFCFVFMHIALLHKLTYF
jgi:hypothetical protein